MTTDTEAASSGRSTSAATSATLGAALDAYGDLDVAGNGTNNIAALNIGGGLGRKSRPKTTADFSLLLEEYS